MSRDRSSAKGCIFTLRHEGGIGISVQKYIGLHKFHKSLNKDFQFQTGGRIIKSGRDRYYYIIRQR